MRNLLGVSVLVNVLLVGWVVIQQQPHGPPPAQKKQTLGEFLLKGTQERLFKCQANLNEALDGWEADIRRLEQVHAQRQVQAAEFLDPQAQLLQREQIEFYRNLNRQLSGR